MKKCEKRIPFGEKVLIYISKEDLYPQSRDRYAPKGSQENPQKSGYSKYESMFPHAWMGQQSDPPSSGQIPTAIAAIRLRIQDLSQTSLYLPGRGGQGKKARFILMLSAPFLVVAQDEG
jgi:hypothetical protein